MAGLVFDKILGTGLVTNDDGASLIDTSHDDLITKPQIGSIISAGNSDSVMYTVPVGKRLLISNFWFECNDGNGITSEIYIKRGVEANIRIYQQRSTTAFFNQKTVIIYPIPKVITAGFVIHLKSPGASTVYACLHGVVLDA